MGKSSISSIQPTICCNKEAKCELLLSDKAIEEFKVAITERQEIPQGLDKAVELLAGADDSKETKSILTKLLTDINVARKPKLAVLQALENRRLFVKEEDLLLILGKEKDFLIKQRLIYHLGLMGSKKVLKAVQKYSKNKSSMMSRVSHFAQTLLNYRLGLSDSLLAEHAPQENDPGHVKDLPVFKAACEAMEKEEHLLCALPEKFDGVYKLKPTSCDCIFGYFENTSFGVDNRKSLFETPALLGILGRSLRKRDQFEPYLFFLTHPVDSTRLRVNLMTKSGDIMYTGVAKPKKDSISLSIQNLQSVERRPTSVLALWGKKASVQIFRSDQPLLKQKPGYTS